MKISVALLVKNGGTRFAETLAAVCTQAGSAPFEVLAIDSGSTDGSLERMQANPRVRVVRIGPADFQHGRTRNLAMREASGALVAFLTQDAVPANAGWLAAFERFMDEHAEVAGAFGHQVPHDGADPLEAFEVAKHFESFRAGPAVFRASPVPLPLHERLRQHYFSNVNSCIRRTAWERIPFPELDFGEDQSWAFEVQERGMATGYCASAVVRHSHDYGAATLFGRRYDEARFMRRRFGYAIMPSWGHATEAARANAGMYRRELASGARAHPGASSRAWAAALGLWAGTRFADRDGLVHRMISLTERRLRA